MKLLCGDCLELLPTLPASSVDLVLTDPPYGTTECNWDAIIPIEPMWKAIGRVLRPGRAVVFTASQPFSSALVLSRPKAFAHAWAWDKGVGANFVQAKRQPLKVHEDVLVFGLDGKQPSYFPQMTPREKPVKMGGRKQGVNTAIPMRGKARDNAHSLAGKVYNEAFPRSVLSFSSRADPDRGLHPTQKPVALMEYLIRTYTNEGETVLDFTMGSGTTGVACANTGRKFIGIERDPTYFAVAEKRVVEAAGVFG